MNRPPAASWLNYHHLLYFWTVARTGSVTRASAELNLTQPAISAQLRTLERSVGAPLFVRKGRALALTEVGQLAFRYADEIFRTGRELQQQLAGGPAGRPMRLTVGITDALPKLIAHRLLEPALALDPPVLLVLREDRIERLLADLSIHALDLVLADAPVPPTVMVRAYSHLLGECGITLFGAPRIAARYRRRFPASLDGAPFVLPGDGTTLRRSLEQWFASEGVRPAAVAEIEDSALLKVFGAGGLGLFAAPTVVEDEVRRQYGVRVVGRIDAVRERFHALTVERRISHPAVLAITRAARQDLFG